MAVFLDENWVILFWHASSCLSVACHDTEVGVADGRSEVPNGLTVVLR